MVGGKAMGFDREIYMCHFLVLFFPCDHHT